MDIEMEEKLKEKYQNIDIRVSYVDIRHYNVEMISSNINEKFLYIYDAHLTFETNITIIMHKIDNIILEYYRK